MKKSFDLNKAINQLIISLEDNNDGKNRIEKEFVYYLKLKDIPNFIERNSSVREEQEQYEIKIPKAEESEYNSRIRVRKRIERRDGVDSQPEYILCVKANKEGLQGSIENELTATKEMFDLFKVIAVYGQKKVRYSVGIPNYDQRLIWEVDVFINSDGSINEWVKIDLELPSDYNGEIPNVLNYFDADEAIINQWSNRTEEENQKCKMILDSYKYKEVN